MTIIVCDIHEEKSELFSILKTNAEGLDNLEIKIESLAEGDYKLAETTIVERKTMDDLYLSALGNDKHNLFLQLEKCKVKYPSVVLMIEEKLLYKSDVRKYKIINGVLKRAQLRYGVILKIFKTPKGEANWLISTAEWLQRHNFDPRIAFKPERPFFDKRTEEERQRETFYQGLIDTGLKKAELLNKEFPAPIDFIKWLSSIKIEGNKIIYPENQKQQIKGLGKKWIEKNKRLLFNK